MLEVLVECSASYHTESGLPTNPLPAGIRRYPGSPGHCPGQVGESRAQRDRPSDLRTAKELESGQSFFAIEDKRVTVNCGSIWCFVHGHAAIHM
jgi:hypothetical protein